MVLRRGWPIPPALTNEPPAIADAPHAPCWTGGGDSHTTLLTVALEYRAVEYRILPGLGSMPPGQMAAGRHPSDPTCFTEAA